MNWEMSETKNYTFFFFATVSEWKLVTVFMEGVVSDVVFGLKQLLWLQSLHVSQNSTLCWFCFEYRQILCTFKYVFEFTKITYHKVIIHLVL